MELENIEALMATNNRVIDARFWEQPEVGLYFTQQDKLFYLFLLTNPKVTPWGIYEITPKYIAQHIGMKTTDVLKLISRFEEHHKWIAYSGETYEVCLKYAISQGSWTKNIKYLIGYAKGLREVKDKSLLSEIEDLKEIFGKYDFAADVLEMAEKHSKPTTEKREPAKRVRVKEGVKPLSPKIKRHYELNEDTISEIPKELRDLPDFLKWWGEWIYHRKVMLRKPVTVNAAKIQLEDLLECLKTDGRNEPTRILRKACGGDWQGLWTKKSRGNSRETRPSRISDRKDDATYGKII